VSPREATFFCPMSEPFQGIPADSGVNRPSSVAFELINFGHIPQAPVPEQFRIL